MGMSQNFGNRGGSMAGHSGRLPAVTIVPDGGQLVYQGSSGTVIALASNKTTGLGFAAGGRPALQFGGASLVQALSGNVRILGGQLRVDGGLSLGASATFTSGTTLTTAHTVVPYDASGGAFTINLPASPEAGQRQSLFLVEIGNSANALTLSGNGNNVNGAASVNIATAYKVTHVQWNGTEWVAGV